MRGKPISVGVLSNEAIEVAMVPHIWFIASEIAEIVMSSRDIADTSVPSPPIIRFAITSAS